MINHSGSILYAMLFLAIILHVLDWRQTLYIANHPHTYFEKNWILGNKPRPRGVHAYFLLTAILLIDICLESRFYDIVTGIWIGCGFHSVYNNKKIGIPW